MSNNFNDELEKLEAGIGSAFSAPKSTVDKIKKDKEKLNSRLEQQDSDPEPKTASNA